MAVMAAGMHGRGLRRRRAGPWPPDGQRIHVGAKADRPAARAAADDADDAGAADPLDHLVAAEVAQLPATKPAVRCDIVEKLGMAMDVLAPAGDLAGHGRDGVVDAHANKSSSASR